MRRPQFPTPFPTTTPHTTMKAIPLPVKLTLAWLWVAVPLGWGVCQSAIKSAPLFGTAEESTAPTAPDDPLIELE